MILIWAGQDSLNYRADNPDILPKVIIELDALGRAGKQANDDLPVRGRTFHRVLK